MTHRHTLFTGQGQLSLALALAVIGFLGGCSSPTGPALARKRSWEVSFNQGHASAVAALYAPDAELVMSGETPIRGRTAIGAVIDKMVHSGIKVKISTDRAAAAGDLAYFYGSYETSSSRNVVERGTYLEVWHRYGGRWLIDYDVNAAGAPIAPASQH